MIASSSFLSSLANPFGIFNYDDPVIVNLQGLRAHLFEAHDVTHNANSSEITMHLKMADEEISHFLKNLTVGELDENPNSNLSTALETVQMQLNNTSSIANIGSMTEVMFKLKQADQDLIKSLKDLE
ncbi:MAG: hypothetical protein H0W19_03765 [Nitrosopumilus sp.]|nr:hypothetical protein [Nitrosopumilus sp.]